MYKKAYGKINIILKIHKKKQNEIKHQIDSVMLICDRMYDKIRIKKANSFVVNYFNKYKQILTFKDCSICRAVKWFHTKFPSANINFKIDVLKKIPTNSGFGGESTDAAFVLNYLLRKNNISLTQEQIKDIALNVGSDIPFFMSNFYTAHVTSYGEKVKRIKNILFDYEIYPIMEQCSSQNVYHALNKDKKFNSKYTSSSLYVDAINGTYLFIDFYNDLQKYVFKLYPTVKKHYDKLNSFKKRPIFVNGAGSYLIILR